MLFPGCFLGWQERLELAQRARGDSRCSYLGRRWAGGLSALSPGATLQLAPSPLPAPTLYLAARRHGGGWG